MLFFSFFKYFIFYFNERCILQLFCLFTKFIYLHNKIRVSSCYWNSNVMYWQLSFDLDGNLLLRSELQNNWKEWTSRFPTGSGTETGMDESDKNIVRPYRKSEGLQKTFQRKRVVNRPRWEKPIGWKCCTELASTAIFYVRLGS